MNLFSAYLLISHGSRDPRPQAATEWLAQLVRQRLLHFQTDVDDSDLSDAVLDGSELDNPELNDFDLNNLGLDQSTESEPPISPSEPIEQLDRLQAYRPRFEISTARHRLTAIYPLEPLVGTATLELAPCPLHEQIRQFGSRALAAGYRHLKILPLFLLPGMHVMEDIPAEIAIAQSGLPPALMLDLCPHLGSHAQIQNLLADAVAIAPTAARILVSHGSRRPGGNQPVVAIADELQALPAYWSVFPSLEVQVTALAKASRQEIVILPYFLFAGTITDAIAATVAQISSRFPEVRLHLAQPLSADAAMARLVIDLIR